MQKSQPMTPVPIFILGMPRSVTTLVEQILSCHSEVWGAGGLSNLENGMKKSGLLSSPLILENLRCLGEFYLMALQALKRQENFITDKMPQNFFGLVGSVRRYQRQRSSM